jgi:Rne/Rng family ribonuclease
MLVQVVKDPIMNKGAMLTTNLSLAGRLMVFMPGNETCGISRKIEGEEERQRLKEIINTLSAFPKASVSSCAPLPKGRPKRRSPKISPT